MLNGKAQREIKEDRGDVSQASVNKHKITCDGVDFVTDSFSPSGNARVVQLAAQNYLFVGPNDSKSH